MLQPSADFNVPCLSPGVLPINGEQAVSYVSLDITVPGRTSSASRRALHDALGHDLQRYVVTIDKPGESVTFRVEVTSRTLDEVIAALTHTLSEATVGRAIETTSRHAPHR